MAFKIYTINGKIVGGCCLSSLFTVGYSQLRGNGGRHDGSYDARMPIERRPSVNNYIPNP